MKNYSFSDFKNAVKKSQLIDTPRMADARMADARTADARTADARASKRV
ncbi:hypothetical protein [Cytobacillus sp. IB215665]|nr:hypothetical protein [Cytobacillus sp. IB215665]MDX8367008.1 hypothetical protein [Cytobacillus sp. IB215665]